MPTVMQCCFSGYNLVTFNILLSEGVACCTLTGCCMGSHFISCGSSWLEGTNLDCSFDFNLKHFPLYQFKINCMTPKVAAWEVLTPCALNNHSENVTMRTATQVNDATFPSLGLERRWLLLINFSPFSSFWWHFLFCFSARLSTWHCKGLDDHLLLVSERWKLK